MAKLIGTAGHVDHGKTTLIHALTGIETDRLPEEKSRGMTIDIGFAHVDLPGHPAVSIVDVPGHERFVTNMLVGAIGVNLGLLVVAADEGVRRQTRQHLQIFDLLDIETLVVAVNRSDMADVETREIVRDQIDELLAPTRFAESRVIEVSAKTGDGLPELKIALGAALDEANDVAHGSWVLPIDRVLAVKGHGCVVTGTLLNQSVRVGEEAIIQPGSQLVRIRALENHGGRVDVGEPGRRTGINLVGAQSGTIHRGMTLSRLGSVFETTVIDATLRTVDQIKHGQRVRLALGTDDVVAKAFLNDLRPDIVQFRLERASAAFVNQPVIVRNFSPPEVLAGGRVIVPQAELRRKSQAVEIIETNSPEDGIVAIVGATPQGVQTEKICRRLGKTAQDLGQTFEVLQLSGRVISFGGLWFSEEGLSEGTTLFLDALQDLHDRNPTVSYVPRETVLKHAKLSWSGKALDRLISHLSKECNLDANGTGVRLASFAIQLTQRQRDLLNRLKDELEKAPINVATPRDLARFISVPTQAIDEIIKLGRHVGELIAVGDEFVYTSNQIAQLKLRLTEKYANEFFTASEFRDEFETSRRYAIPLLEHLDSINFTTRVGDQRKINM